MSPLFLKPMDWCFDNFKSQVAKDPPIDATQHGPEEAVGGSIERAEIVLDVMHLKAFMLLGIWNICQHVPKQIA